MAAGLYTQAGCVVCTASERDGVRVWWVQQVAMRSDLFGREKGPSASSRKNQIGFTCGGGKCTLYIASMLRMRGLDLVFRHFGIFLF